LPNPCVIGDLRVILPRCSEAASQLRRPARTPPAARPIGIAMVELLAS
jgi:hypothetical protein